MKKRIVWISSLLLAFVSVTVYLSRSRPRSSREVSLAISPYQDIATIVSFHTLGLDKKYNIDLTLQTMAWEDILPTLASNGQTVDMGFASYTEFLTKERDLNRGATDPLVYVFPAYVFHGGAFITFEPEVPNLDSDGLNDQVKLGAFLSRKIGAPKGSLWELMIFSVARRAHRQLSSVSLYDSPINDSLLATEKKSLDIGGAGLTQMTEATKRGGRVVLDMDALKFADITGFVCRKSTLTSRRAQVESVIRIWYDTAHYVMSDLDKHSAEPLDYLRKNSATQYTLEQYKTALAQEYFPQTIQEAKRDIVSSDGKYSAGRIAQEVIDYLRAVRGFTEPPDIPDFIDIQ